MTKKDTINNFAPNLSSNSLEKKPVEDGIDYERHPEAKGQIIDGEYVKDKGMNWFVAALFLVGDMAGGGIVALPTAVQQSGFILGCTLCIIMAIVGTASAIFLGKSWEHLPVKWPEYRLHCRKPYAEIGYRALGHKVRTFVSVCLNITQFGICVVFLLLAARNIHDFIYSFWPGVPGLCYIIIILGIALLPIIFLKSPEDFWWAIVAGMMSTVVAVCLIMVGAKNDYEVCNPERHEPTFNIFNLFVAFGTVVFTFGGHSAFPTIQHDMKRPSQFTKSSIVAFTTICVFYAPVVIIAYLTYGDSLRDSIIPSIQTSWIQQAVNMMIAAHCILTLTLMINPLNQETEEFFDIPHHFGVKRITIRAAMMAAIVFTAETVPNFGPVLNLMGASTVTLTCVIFPSIFYLYIKANEKKSLETGREELCTFSEMVERTDKKVFVFCTFILIVGLIGGVCATVSAVKEITTTSFEVPCYLRNFYEQTQNSTETSTNCCGKFQNITVGGQEVSGYCNKPSLEFYGHWFDGNINDVKSQFD
ncbi:unnamed protein product [Bursaphelenchus okinawaensis]|uniref:Amino acid transporter transmembrane domain-containing protein n=1 Tax=Bursaphelenchus okinawaensis TaxID=465554 RepID=A0A811KCY5_9BILA|nr:unnamed protein product [Bursaphelenchus okinawaensis]CAG9099553.1 unnamed protein product [Bursaphelenchus okinawaensis]